MATCNKAELGPINTAGEIFCTDGSLGGEDLAGVASPTCIAAAAFVAIGDKANCIIKTRTQQTHHLNLSITNVLLVLQNHILLSQLKGINLPFSAQSIAIKSPTLRTDKSNHLRCTNTKRSLNQ